MNVDEMFLKQTAEELIRQQIRDGFLYTLDNGKQWISRNGVTSMVERLSWRDVNRAGKCGIDTRTHSREKKYKCKLNKVQQRPENIWGIEVEPRCAELAVANFLGIDWHCHVDKFMQGGDVGKWTQVRHSFNNDNGLKVRPGNPLNKPYVQVSGGNSWYLIHGWEWGWKVTHRPQAFADTSTPCWFCDQKDLQPMSDFPGEPDFDVEEEVPDDQLCEFIGWTHGQWEAMTMWKPEWGNDPRELNPDMRI